MKILKETEILSIGIPPHLVSQTQQVLKAASEAAKKRGSKRNFQKVVGNLLNSPQRFVEDPCFGELAKKIVQFQRVKSHASVAIRCWGSDLIGPDVVDQLKCFTSHPNCVAAALMPDAHGGVGMPVGSVLALDHAVCPSAIGLDIGCRMKLSILDLPVPKKPYWDETKLDNALWHATYFGFHEKPAKRLNHEVMDRNWNISKITKRRKTRAWSQLGTSGGGNHFAEFGLLDVPNDFGHVPAGKYLSLLSHSGSRGAGADIAKWYIDLAYKQALANGENPAESMACFDMDSELGQEYWLVMNLMGAYASANHDVIHQEIVNLLGAEVLGIVENHHNFIWLEPNPLDNDQSQLYVHRKGATPAHEGQLGIIPGSMSAPARIVVGKGNVESLCSASHGAGRKWDRRFAKKNLELPQVLHDLHSQNVRLLQGSVDESPSVYKDINAVMESQRALVQTIATFQPKIVRMQGRII